MSRESVHKKLERDKPPRVHVTYDVEIGNAIEVKELPFVMGVLGDFTGQPVEPLARLKDRKFVDVKPDNFDTVLAGMKPHLSFSVKNTLDPKKDDLKVNLDFKRMEDFNPAEVAEQIGPLKELLDLRRKLLDLKATLQPNDKLDELLMEAAKNAEKRGELKKALGLENAEEGSK